MPRYTLRELRDAALKECPEAFQLVSDINTYTFERRVSFRADLHFFEQDVLHLAFVQIGKSEDPVYAFINPVNSKVSILSGLPENGCLLPLPCPLTPDPNVMRNFTRFVTPFDHAVEHPLPRSHEEHDGYIARKEKNSRIVLLAQWAFLLTGRIGYIENTGVEESEILGEFVALCVHIHRQSKLAAEANQVPSKDDKPAPGNMMDARL